VEARPGLKTRVMVSLREAPRRSPRGWLVPAAASAAVAALTLSWFLAPSTPQDTREAPMVAQQRPVTTMKPIVGPVPTTEAARATPSGGSGHEATTIEAAAARPVAEARKRVDAPSAVVASAASPLMPSVVTWAPSPVAEVPSLPPLAGPPPIVIEPIAWSEITIKPVNVEPIEVKALVIEPLHVMRLGGV